MEACLFPTDFSFESSYIQLFLFLAGFASGRRKCAGIADGVVTGTGSKNAVLVPVRRVVEALVRRVALLEGKLVEAHRSQEVAEEKAHDLSRSLAEDSQ
jgi:hypothetical protein